jgi:CO dehydrogenase/acetyl-CoA synthase gamma subunit (corrinoid Fe-S protein)
VRNDEPFRPNAAAVLDDNMAEAMRKMMRMNEIIEKLPGYDCGSCGSPTCAAFAEDIVRGYCTENDCIHLMKEKLQVMAQQMLELAQTKRE